MLTHTCNTTEITETNLESIFNEALDLASPDTPAQKKAVEFTTHRTLTRRGVIWLGQTCNLRCQFCYFVDRVKSANHPEHAFMSLAKAKKICKTLVDIYGNNAVDIQGGEPTIYRDIFELIRYCNDIGLKPTLITNALVLDDKGLCRQFKDAGIKDFLISVHGLGQIYNTLVGKENAHIRQMKALRNLQEEGVPFRFNCVLAKPIVEQLPFIAELAVRTTASTVNFIAFNPFEDQSEGGKRSATNVPRYLDVSPMLTKALDILDNAGVEANVRYFPFCMVEERHRKSIYNFQQLPYDHHEWDYASWAWTGLQPQRMKQGEPSDPVRLSNSRLLIHFKKPLKRLSNISILRSFLYKIHQSIAGLFSRFKSEHTLYRDVAKMHSEVHCTYAYSKSCDKCNIRNICDGFHGDYAKMFGTDEATAIISGEITDDPCYYIRHQNKIIDADEQERI
jgi:sulfatase maturation enzyme AslB (radical SAM superfamily)